MSRYFFTEGLHDLGKKFQHPISENPAAASLSWVPGHIPFWGSSRWPKLDMPLCLKKSRILLWELPRFEAVLPCVIADFLVQSGLRQHGSVFADPELEAVFHAVPYAPLDAGQAVVISLTLHYCRWPPKNVRKNWRFHAGSIFWFGQHFVPGLFAGASGRGSQ